MLQQWERQFPGRLDNMFRALQNVVPSHLADRSLFDFTGLAPLGEPNPGGDTAFDREPIRASAFPVDTARIEREEA
jgi:tRNA 2-thiocytidine biosynthesis protein TtcA